MHPTRRNPARLFVLGLAMAAAIPLATPATAGMIEPQAYADASISTATVTVPMVFPVLGPTSFSDTFLACRSGCTRKHFGQDLMGPKMRLAVAAFDGYVYNIKRESYVGEGNYITIKGDNGWSVNYIHMNNDTPGTDDGRGTANFFLAPGMYEGKRVFQGEFIGWSGDSGNAESTGPHIHFELRKGSPWSGTVYNAYSSLTHARRLSAPTTSGPHPQGSYIKGCATTCSWWQIDRGQRRQVIAEVAKELAIDSRYVIPVSQNEARWYPQGKRVQLPPGRAYQSDDGLIWFVTDGVRFLVPDWDALAALGIARTRVRHMTYPGLRTVPVAPSWATLPTNVVYDGALYRQPGSTTSYWYVRNGERHAITDAFTLKSWGLADADAITLPEPPVPPVDPTDGTGDLTGDPSPDPQPEELVLPEIGGPLPIHDGLVVRSSASGVRYFLTNGVRRGFLSNEVYVRYAYNKVLVQTPPREALVRMPGVTALPYALS